MSQKAYETAQTFVDKWEGYVSNDAGDAGGLTKYGVSMKYLKSIGKRGDINGDGKVDEADVMAVTREKQRELFKADFWDSISLDQVPDRIAIVVYDASVNCGASQSVKFLQRVLGVSDDGKMGPITIKAASAKSSPEDDLKTALAICDRRDAFYREISKKGQNSKFLKGWLNRVEDCRKLLRAY